MERLPTSYLQQLVSSAAPRVCLTQQKQPAPRRPKGSTASHLHFAGAQERVAQLERLAYGRRWILRYEALNRELVCGRGLGLIETAETVAVVLRRRTDEFLSESATLVLLGHQGFPFGHSFHVHAVKRGFHPPKAQSTKAGDSGRHLTVSRVDFEVN